MANKYDKNRLKGFTLVELSIVIIIIGFIIAGIAAGTSLIEQARLNSLIRGLQEYQTAFNNFQGRYQAIPGDISYASNFWPANCTTSVVAADCNGNGNGAIDTVAEQFLGWRHLTLAGMIATAVAPVPASVLVVGSVDGSYQVAISDGLLSDSTDTIVIGTNFPASPIEGVGYGFIRNTMSPFVDSTHALIIGKYLSSNGSLISPALTPFQAFKIDEKMDDGIYDSAGYATGYLSGFVRAGGAGTCGDLLTKSYVITNSSVACVTGYAINDPGQNTMVTYSNFR